MNDRESTYISFSFFGNSFNFLEKISILISTFFFTGLLPIAPGTWGSLAGLGGYLLIADLPWQQQTQIILALTLVAVSSIAILQKKAGDKDDGRIVIDEVVGMLITVAGFPKNWMWLSLGFFLFRAYDIWKPFPARYFDQNVHGAWGVMLDDIMAGIYALATMKVIEALFVYV